jgi:hypothetical protein
MRREVSQVRMQPTTIVEQLDVLEDLPSCLFTGDEDPIPDQGLIRGETPSSLDEDFSRLAVRK